MDRRGLDGLALGAREGLPDALRVLAERHPRPGWEAHPEFNALTRFWLDRHLMFRRLQATLTAETQGVLDRAADPRRAASAISRLARVYLGELEGHHNVEDAHYFPLLRALDPRLVAGFDLLDADHHALHESIDALAARTDAALRGLAAKPADLTPSGALLTELTRFGRLLDRHLVDEEELIVPVILEHRGAGLD
jgi:iron-sulfur cluster repair protein YtfE (RIC family)